MLPSKTKSNSFYLSKEKNTNYSISDFADVKSYSIFDDEDSKSPKFSKTTPTIRPSKLIPKPPSSPTYPKTPTSTLVPPFSNSSQFTNIQSSPKFKPNFASAGFSFNFINYGLSRFPLGHYDSIGSRPRMEDVCVSYRDFAGPNTQYYALFDGHGGTQVSTLLADKLHTLISYYFKRGINFKTAMIKALQKVNEISLGKSDEDSLSILSGGSTAAIAIIYNSVLYTANVGDSRIVLIEENKRQQKPVVTTLTVDHRPSTNHFEKSAVLRRGGYIRNGRVNGILMISRSVGDADVAKYISAVPHITETIIPPRAKLVIACDGIWDVLNEETVANIFVNKIFPQDAAKAIVTEALKRGTSDNVSVMCMNLYNS